VTLSSAEASPQGGLFDLGIPAGSFSDAFGLSADGSIAVGWASRAGGLDAAFRWTATGGAQDLMGGAHLRTAALGVSADGRFVHGVAFFHTGRQAFRWSATTGFERLGSLGANAGQMYTTSAPRAISADGSVIVGWSLTPQGDPQAFRWTQATGLVDLGTFGGRFSEALGVSADGNVVVGTSGTASSLIRGFRWEASTGMVDLGTLGGSNTVVSAVNADGTVITGSSLISPGVVFAFRWTAATGMVNIGTTGSAGSAGAAISADGNAIVGDTSNGTSPLPRAFHWTAATGMVQLGTLGGSYSRATAISADGRVVVGTSPGSIGPFERAFRWSASTGMLDLGTYGGESSVPRGINADGSVIVGSSFPAGGNAPRAFRWELGATVAIGDRYCQNGIANSSGRPGRLEVHGNNAISANDCLLVASQLPPQVLGLFLASMTQDTVPALGGGQGTLCLGGAIGRFAAPGQIQITGAAGSFDLVLDLAALPLPSGLVAAASGESWYFQAWHRDTLAWVTSSNLTDAVGVTYR